jgi:uncharacterized protein (DUF1330 family)
MKGYLVANVDVEDLGAYEAYRSQTGAIVERHGGRFIVRGGRVDRLEGDLPIGRLVIIEFPSLEAVHGFYDSAEYQAIVPLRTSTSIGTLCAVEGAPD